jgi:fatty-acyl-CoA synthase
MGLKFQEKAEESHSYPLLISHLLNTALLTAPNQQIVYRDQYRGTYSKFYQRINKLANLLAEHGVEQGTVVAVLDWDSHRYLECFFAVPMMGAVLQTVNVRLALDQIQYTLEHAGAQVLLVHRDFVDLVDGMRDSLPMAQTFIWIDEGTGSISPEGYLGEYEAMLDRTAASYPFVEFDENAVATTFYTTGTTGHPKAVSFTHRQLVLHTLSTLSTLAAQAPEGLGRHDVYMPLTPMFHVHAWGLPYVATLLGLKQVYPGKYDAQEIVELREKEAVTFSHCVPTILQMVLDAAEKLNKSLDGWALIIGGAAFTKELCTAAMKRGLRVFAGYGMSETGPVLCMTRSLTEPKESTTQADAETLCKTGLPIHLVNLRIVDQDMNDIPPDGFTQGEIVVRAPWLTPSYLRNNEASKDLWRGGWLHTQDVATIDNKGYVQIRDRLKDVIKSGGEWISSLQLEDLLVSHPAVLEAAVIGVPDPQWSERPAAFIVVAEGHDAPELNDLRQHLQPSVDNGIISRFALPDVSVTIEHLPKTSVGKIDKKALRRLFAERS